MSKASPTIGLALDLESKVFLLQDFGLDFAHNKLVQYGKMHCVILGLGKVIGRLEYLVCNIIEEHLRQTTHQNCIVHKQDSPIQRICCFSN